MKKTLLLILLVLVACTTQIQTPPDAVVSPPSIKVCPQDAKQCADGTYVSRNSNNNCEFDLCPTVKKNCPLDTKECAGGIVVSRNPDKNCDFNECPFQIDRDFVATYKDGRVDYVAKITKKTPCYSFNITQQIVETTPQQVIINLKSIRPPKDEICIQVESQEVVTGYVLVKEKPLSLAVMVDNVQIYSTKEFE